MQRWGAITMFDNEISSPNEKLKSIRNLIGATQGEVAKGICTRTNISFIENDKQKLTINLASRFTKRLNEIAKEKSIDIKITEDDFMQDEDSQANDIFLNTITELEETKVITIFEKKLRKLEALIEKYNITDSRKIELYKLSSDFYYNRCFYLKSDEMCNRGVHICITSKNILEESHFYVNKARNYTEQGLYNESLEQLIKAEKICNNICDSELFERLYYNKALVYKKLSNYDESLRHLDILMDKLEFIDKKMLLKVKMLHANCLNEQHKLEQSKKEYLEILYIAIKIYDKDFIAQTYRNLSELYLNQGNYEVAAKYIKDSLKNHPENEYLNDTLYFAAKVIQNIGEDIETYLLQALDICEKNDSENLTLIEKIIYEMILIYIKKEDEENLMLIAEKAKVLNIDYSLIYAEAGEYYRCRNEEKSKYFSSKSREKMKQIKNI